MEVFITIFSTVVLQLGLCVFCFIKKQSSGHVLNETSEISFSR